MKPHQLIAALMARENLGSLPLAKRLGKAKLQAPIYRFARGEVAEPARSTAQPLADYFKIPVDAIYDEKVATRIAEERGLEIVALPAPRERKRTSFAPALMTKIMAAVARGEMPDENAGPAERKFHVAVQKAFVVLREADPNGPTGTTRPADLDDGSSNVTRLPSTEPKPQRLVSQGLDGLRGRRAGKKVPPKTKGGAD